jgi:hypothetical protein
VDKLDVSMRVEDSVLAFPNAQVSALRLGLSGSMALTPNAATRSWT